MRQGKKKLFGWTGHNPGRGFGVYSFASFKSQKPNNMETTEEHQF